MIGLEKKTREYQNLGGTPMNTDIIESQFLFEKWGIQARKTLLERFRDATTVERELINQEFTLTNLFELRRGQDPGFCTFVYQSIQKDKFALFKTKKLILKLLSEATEDPDELLNRLDSGAIHIDMIFDQSDRNTRLVNRQRTLEYYMVMKERALEKNDYDQVFATDSVINEYKFGFTGFDIQLSYDRYKDPDFNEQYNIIMRKFVFTSIDRLNIYNESELNFDIISVIDFLNPFFSDLILKYLRDLLGEDLPSEAIIVYNKLLRDIMSIVSIEWFLGLDFSEKIAILNQQYELRTLLSTIDVKPLLKSEQHILMTHWTNKILNDLGFHKEASDLSVKIVQLEVVQNNVEVLLQVYDDIAYGYKRSGNIKLAVRYFIRKIKLLAREKLPGHYYHISVAYKNIAELFALVNNEEKALEFYKKAEKFLPKLTLQEKYGVYSNLAMASQRTIKFSQERQYLEKILRLPGDNPYINRAHERLKILDTKSDHELLILLKTPEIAEVMKNAKIQANAWNFTKAIDSLAKLLTEIPVELQTERISILQELGLLEFYQSNFQDALTHFLESQELQEKPSTEDFHISSYIIAIGILTRNDLLVSQNLDLLFPIFRSNRVLLSSFLRQTGFLILLGSKKTYELNIKSFRDHFVSNHLNISSLFGQFLLLYGYYDLALENFRAGVECTTEKIEKASLFLKIGITHSQMGDFRNAIKNLKRSLELNPQIEQVYVSMAINYASLNNYTQSIEILKQGRNQLKEAKVIQELLEKYKTLEQDVLNIDSRLPERLRRILYEGERLYQSYLTTSNTEELDVSSIILQYSKFVESALDHYIAYPFFQSIIAEKGWSIRKSFWPRSDQIFHKYKRAIEQNNRKQLTLGQWEFIIERFEEQRNTENPSLIEKYFDNNKDSTIDKECILDVCSTLKSIRNPVIHKDIIELDKLMQRRPDIIQKINLLISLLLKIK